MERLQELRTLRGLSLSELAKAIDVNAVTISHYEKGRRKPNTNHLKALSDFFNVSIEYLCGIEKDNKEDIEKISKIISRSPILYNYVNKDSRISIMNLEKYILSLAQNRCKLK